MSHADTSLRDFLEKFLSYEKETSRHNNPFVLLWMLICGDLKPGQLLTGWGTMAEQKDEMDLELLFLTQSLST